jgi:hypothetical protein
MDRRRKMRIWSRQVTALVAALSLILHVGLMALATQPPLPPSIERAASAGHVQHSGDADESHHEGHGSTASHAKPCCILSYVTGMPASPAGSLLIPPHAPSSILDLWVEASSGSVPLRTYYPVGARAPPAVV